MTLRLDAPRTRPAVQPSVAAEPRRWAPSRCQSCSSCIVLLNEIKECTWSYSFLFKPTHSCGKKKYLLMHRWKTERTAQIANTWESAGLKRCFIVETPRHSQRRRPWTKGAGQRAPEQTRGEAVPRRVTRSKAKTVERRRTFQQSVLEKPTGHPRGRKNNNLETDVTVLKKWARMHHRPERKMQN